MTPSAGLADNGELPAEGKRLRAEVQTCAVPPATFAILPASGWLKTGAQS
ncbi:hypothetical protein [Sphingomonas alpina]|uniref:Uncharacterized protein n=1 Tax=Sphingomonas alpina TaxID=653931 RepID=A0A7H0LJV5_9SPHN|nr:hypothetical protein [Sphingomonas alpina]QNQ09958.1 hypothetical protein H3Z74_01495 [Sphingomonas alpina]